MDTYFNITNGDFLTIANQNAYTEDDLKHAFSKALRDIREYSELSLKTISEQDRKSVV